MASANMATGDATSFMASMDFAHLSPFQKGFILSIRSLEEDVISSQMPGNEVKSSVAEMFPPGVLFNDDLMNLPLCHRKLRDWLDSNGANMVQHSSRRVLMTLATNLYDEAEDREAAEEIVKELIARMRSRRDGSSSQETPSLQTSSSATPSRELDSNTAHKVAMRFKEDKKKFSGAIGEYFNDFVSDYLQAARDYDLTPTQKLQYLHNVLTGDAKRFYYNRIEGYAAGFSQAVTMLQDEYNSAVRQDRCKNYLSSLRLAKFADEGLELSSALEKTYKVITKLSPQVPQSHRGEAHKVEFLRKAVVGYEWATEPLSRIATHKLTFQNLYSELESALHLAKEGQLARMGDRIGKSHPKNDDVAGVLYESQGRYLNKHAGLRTRNTPHWKRRGQTKPSSPLDLMGCFNCDDPNHTLNDCKRPVNAARAAQRRLEYYSKKQKKNASVQQVLYELCSQLDSADTLFGTFEELSDEHEEGKESIGEPMPTEENDEAIEEIFYPRD